MTAPEKAKTFRFLPVRAGHVLVELPDLETALALMVSLEREKIDGVQELVPAARTVMISFDPQQVSEARLIEQIARRDLAASQSAGGRLVEIPVCYDGADLAELAQTLGISEAEIIRRHTSAEYTVAFTGFAPGFGYLTGDDPLLNVPRRKTPRTHVPAGSVAIAGGFTGVYPKDSPGGWQLIGSTPLKMFDLERDPAAILQPGYRVRFVETANPAAVAASVGKPVAEQAKKSNAASLEIISTLFPLLFEDEGRPRQAAQGVSISGAADKASYRIANRLVGNRPGTPALEITLGQLRFRMHGKAFMALGGAPAPVSITSPDGATMSAGRYQVVALAEGDIVTIGVPGSGLRSYLAVRGGFDVEPVLGSASRDMLAQIGPPPLVAGEKIGVLSPPANAVAGTGETEPFAMPKARETVTLDVTLGPRTDWFTPDSVHRFLSQEWQVTPQSSRVGIRLNGQALERIDQRELPSEATLQGAVQVPASGQPVLFLADHPITGGYPVIANIAAHHLDLCGQIPIGTKLRLRAENIFPQK